MVDVNVIKDSAYATQGTYSTALAGYSLIIDLDEKKFEQQILSKYTHFFEGELGIDAMTDPTGHILGINANFERFNRDGFNNLKVNEAPFIVNLLKLVD